MPISIKGEANPRPDVAVLRLDAGSAAYAILAGQQPRLVHVLYFDTEVQRVETYHAGQPVTLIPIGGGGTTFVPCFEWLQEHGVCPQTLVFLTDLCGSFPEEAPPYPVIWASTETRPVPFGQIVLMEAA